MSRKPCIACGGPKEPGLGARKCLACREAASKRSCSKCGGPKEPGLGVGKRYCLACTPPPLVPCQKCGSTAPKSVHGRRLCDECQPIETAAAIRRSKARKALKRKPCAGCGRAKGPGSPGRLYCPTCQAERAKPRTCFYCPTPVEKYRKVCAVCRAETKRTAAAQRVAYDKARRASQSYAEREDELRALRAAKRRSTPTTPPRSEIQTLPARPLALAIKNLARIESAGNLWDDLPPDHQHGRIEVLCERIGVSSKSRREWEGGGRDRVRFAVADTAITRAGLAWWEVWPEGTDGHAEAAHLFAGEPLLRSAA